MSISPSGGGGGSGGGEGGLGAGIIGGAAQAYGSYLNFEMQKRNLAWQKYVQRHSWMREDNAVQRRAFDLELAGFNRVLATGQAAQSGPVVSTQAPQIQVPENLPGLAMGLMKMKQDISQSEVQTELNREQIKTQQALQGKAGADTIKAAWDAENSKIEADRKGYDLDITKKSGLPSNPSAPGKLLRDAQSITDQVTKKLFFMPDNFTSEDTKRVLGDTSDWDNDKYNPYSKNR